MVRDRTQLLDEDKAEAGEDGNEPEEPEQPSEPSADDDSQAPQDSSSTATSSSSENSSSQNSQDDEPDEEVNIREDWDGSTYYIKPEQSDKLDDEFRDLKRQMKREDEIIVEKYKHFFRAVIGVSIEENLDQVLQRARELAEEDADQ